MSLTEPVTAVTDGLLAMASASFGLFLFRSRGSSQAKLLWASGFLTAAVAAMLGGAFHGLAAYLEPATRDTMWNLTIALIGVTMGFMVAAGLSSRLNRHARRTYWLVGGGLLTGAGFLIQQSGFSVLAHFNHNDLYHCIQAIALFMVFKCASLTP